MQIEYKIKSLTQTHWDIETVGKRDTFSVKYSSEFAFNVDSYNF